MTDLSTKTGTVSSVYVDWTKETNGRGSSKYEQLAKSSSIAKANEEVIASLRQYEGHGISSAQIKKQSDKLNRCKNPSDGLFILVQAILSGSGLSVI